VLTGTTAQLETFFGAYLKRPGVTTAPSTWIRR
jgi:hypothetical protein